MGPADVESGTRGAPVDVERDTLEPEAEVALRDTAHPDAVTRDAQSPANPRADTFVEKRMKNRVFGRLFDKRERLRIGRYDILENIGSGGMGVVYSAYDDELDRKIAIKLLIGDEVATETTKLRFKREAQAMARLSHTNVVAIHEVGEADGKVFIAMEFVRGESLDAHCMPLRPWAEVVALYIQAGRGLIAAHEAGLVHRDLKPHNIIRAEDGVVKVLDFGLARADSKSAEFDATDAQPDLSAAIRGGSTGSVLEAHLTHAGALLGTPAYMAPELFDGHSADARSDQFSFCVALYEGLYGQLPFAGSTFNTLVANIEKGAIDPPPSGIKVPGWLHRIILRGLAADPGLRWPSMQTLVDALARERTRKRQRTLAGVGLAVLTGIAGFSIAELRGGSPVDCGGAALDLAEVWSEGRRERVQGAFAASGHRLAEDTIARVLPKIDAYAADWSSMRVEACERHSAGQESDRFFDLRTACLDRRRAGLDTLLTAFEGADGSIVEGAAWATASLDSLAGCADVEALTATVPLPEDPDVRREVQLLREALAGAASLVDVGAYDEAAARATQVLSRAAALEYEPLEAEAYLSLGTAELDAHKPERARESLSQSIRAAIRSGQEEVAAEALSRRMWIVAEPLGEPELGLADAGTAEAFVDKVGARPLQRWLFLNNHGAALYRSGDAEAAEAAYRAAIKAIESVDRELPVETISTGMNLATLLYSRGRPEAAATELRRVRESAVSLLGVGHPRVAFITILLTMCLNEYGRRSEALALLGESFAGLDPSAAYLRAYHHAWFAMLRLYTRDYAGALEHAELAVRTCEPDFVEDHLWTFSLDLRGVARIGVGDVDGGLRDLRAALTAEEARLSPDHEDVGHARWWLGSGLLDAGQVDEAIVELERANQIYAAQGSFASSLLGRQSFRLVEALLQNGPTEPAAKALERALDAQELAGFDRDNEHRATLLKLRGHLRRRLGDLEEATTDYNRACEVFARTHDADDPMLAECRLGWSKALGDTAEGRRLAKQAHEAYRQLGPAFADELPPTTEP